MDRQVWTYGQMDRQVWTYRQMDRQGDSYTPPKTLDCRGITNEKRLLVVNMFGVSLESVELVWIQCSPKFSQKTPKTNLDK